MGKKKKKKDFEKVKLKVGKTIKRENVNLSFRTKTIKIHQDLKTPAAADGKRKLGLKELFAHCKHHSISVRHDALSRLHELFTEQKELLKQQRVSHVSLVQTIFPLLTDDDVAVRHAFLKLAKLILPITSGNSAAFKIISLSVCCGLTNFNENVRLDSLKVFDMLLDLNPKSLVSRSGQLIPVFINHVAGYRTSHQQSSSGGIMINPGSKMSSWQGRRQVLERLQKLLEAIVDIKLPKWEPPPKGTTAYIKGTHLEGTMDVFFPEHVRQQWIQRPFTDEDFKADFFDVLFDDDLLGRLQGFVVSLMQLLLQYWMECCLTTRKEAKTGSALRPEFVSVLTTIAHIMQCLIKIWLHFGRKMKDPSAIEWVRTKYWKDIHRWLLDGFPFTVMEHESSGGSKRKAKVTQVPLTTLHLAICDIAIHFISDKPDGEQNSILTQKMTDYLKQLFTKGNLKADRLKFILTLLDRLRMQSSDWCQGVANMLLDAALTWYLSSDHNPDIHKVSLDHFGSIAIWLPNLPFSEPSHGLPASDRFLRCLVDLLLCVHSTKPETACHIASLICDAVVQNKMQVIDAVQSNLSKLFDTNSGIILTLSEDGVQLLIGVLQWLKSIEKKNADLFSRLALHPKMTQENTRWLMGVLRYRFQDRICEDETKWDMVALFMLTYVKFSFGHTEEEFDTILQHEKTTVSPFGCTIWTCLRNYNMDKFVSIVEEVSTAVGRWPDSLQAITLIEQWWRQFIQDRCIVPVTTALGALRSWATFLVKNRSTLTVSDSWATQLATMCLGLATDTISLRNDQQRPVDVEQESLAIAWKTCMDFFSNAPTVLLERILHLGLEQIKGPEGMKCAQLLVDTLTQTLQYPTAQQRLREESCSCLLQEIHTHIQTSLPNLESQQWWTDFSYQLSLNTQSHINMAV